MNVHAAEGVLEAIANRSLLDYVRTTDIADVAILPVGLGPRLPRVDALARRAPPADRRGQEALRR